MGKETKDNIIKQIDPTLITCSRCGNRFEQYQMKFFTSRKEWFCPFCWKIIQDKLTKIKVQLEKLGDLRPDINQNTIGKCIIDVTELILASEKQNDTN